MKQQFQQHLQTYAQDIREIGQAIEYLDLTLRDIKERLNRIDPPRPVPHDPPPPPPAFVNDAGQPRFGRVAWEYAAPIPDGTRWVDGHRIYPPGYVPPPPPPGY
jgi:hypothetical protein